MVGESLFGILFDAICSLVPARIWLVVLGIVGAAVLFTVLINRLAT